MARVLIQFAHPAFERSRVNRRLWQAIADLDGVTRNDLYEVYPDFDIDVASEQALLAAHDIVVFQHPLHWYATPAILKQWMDLVLEHGWAYGTGGDALAGKRWIEAVTTGGGETAYRHDGANRFTLRELMAPIEQTARLCRMDFVPPFVVHGTHRMEEPQIEAAALRYRGFVTALRDDRIDFAAARGMRLLDGVLEPSLPAPTEPPRAR
ncbi:MAG: NAD(P)H-dependent oxidoreductase [Thermoanaerobaculia bacterium]|nr:NAD(P)H-dependent oxidoreductase [Thermoanaerobaculia bacterium]